MTEKGNCAHCDHWSANQAATSGSCRVRAPVAIPNPRGDRGSYPGFLTVFPRTTPSDWCGEWVPREQPREELQ